MRDNARDGSRGEECMKIVTSKKVRGLTLVEVLAAVLVLVLLIVVLLPRNPNRRATAFRIQCISNLKQLGIGVSVWSGDCGDKWPWQVSVTNGGTREYIGTSETFRHFQVLSNELGTPRLLFCPEESKRRFATNFTSDFNNSGISYFLNTDATANDPNLVLSGDGNLTLNGALVKSGALDWRSGDVLRW